MYILGDVVNNGLHFLDHHGQLHRRPPIPEVFATHMYSHVTHDYDASDVDIGLMEFDKMSHTVVLYVQPSNRRLRGPLGSKITWF